MKHTTFANQVLSVLVAKYEDRHGEKPRGACQHDAVDNRTPFDELVDKESAQLAAANGTMALFPGDVGPSSNPFEELEDYHRQAALEGEEAVRMKMEAFHWLLDFVFAGGPHPAVAMRRLYVLVKSLRPDLIWEAGYRDLGKLFGETGAAVEWRLGKLIDEYAAAKGCDHKMPWQRTAESCKTYSQSQLENNNRLGGKRSGAAKADASKQ